MRKSDLILRLAEDGHTSPGEAADQLDAMVHATLMRLRDGKPAVWPGLGSFQPIAGKPLIRFKPADERAAGSPVAVRKPRKGKNA
ncbi:MAG: hypothetical protein R2762_20050 [Bryobacteraceae bacterium]